MATVTIKYSARLQRMVSPRQRDDELQKTLEQLGLWLLGRQSEVTPGKAILDQSFKKWRGVQNSHTKTFPAYDKHYGKWKQAERKPNWLKVSGDLYHDAITAARVDATPRNVTITASKGKSSAYAATHQHGSRRTRKRPPYMLTVSDAKRMAVFLQKQLVRAFGGSGAVVKVTP